VPHTDSDEQGRSGGPLVLSALVDCDVLGGCGEVFNWTLEDYSISLEDMAEAPVADVTCPECGAVQTNVAWPGWMFRSEAG
jgi:catabolite regulation protein CreA